LKSIIFFHFHLFSNEWMENDMDRRATHSSRGGRCGHPRRPNFVWGGNTKNDQPSVCVCVCVRAHWLQYIWDMGAAYICQCVSCRPVERGGENWIEWPFVGHCWKNRIARTNTWTSLEKGGNIKGNMMLVCTVDSAWEQEKNKQKTCASKSMCIFPF
jgi:hypothetical protein